VLKETLDRLQEQYLRVSGSWIDEIILG